MSRYALRDLPLSELFWWMFTSLDRVRACAAEIGRRYSEVPYWEMVEAESARVRKTTEFHQRELEKWIALNPES